jgi:hypothetical protein
MPDVNYFSELNRENTSTSYMATGSHWTKSENSVRLRIHIQFLNKSNINLHFLVLFIFKTSFLTVKRCFVSFLTVKGVLFTKQAMPTILVLGRPWENTQKNTKNQPKIGEFLASKVVWTLLLCIFASMFDFFKYIIVQFV